jgi:chemotaxis signal transduction protein
MFVDADDNVVASTAAIHPTGTKAGLPAALRAAAQDGTAQLIALDGQVMAVGGQGSSGYREYRGTEGRSKQPLLALVCVPLGVDDGQQGQVEAGDGDGPVLAVAATAAVSAGDTIDIASFYVGRYLLGVPAAAVVEAIPFGGIVRLPNASDTLCGATIYQGSTMLLYDLHNALGVSARSRRENMLTVVLRGAGGRPFGILVDRLADIPAVPLADIAPVSSVFMGVTPILASVVSSHGGPDGAMLTLLAVDKMLALLNQAG